MKPFSLSRLGLVVAAFLVGIAATLVATSLAPDPHELDGPVPPALVAGSQDFALTMGGLFGSPVMGGNSIETLLNGDEIFPAMLEAIAAAQETINFETYVYWSGEIGERFARALAERAQSGVEVRVMLDWQGSVPMEEDLHDIMRAAGVVVERFRPIHWYTLDRINNRTHRKLLIVDGRIGFTGGVGIGDKWLGDARNPEEWRDNHYRVEGPVVADMQAAFAENWLEATNEVLQGDRFYPEQTDAGELFAQHVKSSPTGGSRSMHQMLTMAIAAAERHVRIAMAYFVPDDVMIAQLLDARRRGVEIDIIVPSGETDVPMTRHASRHFWGPMLRAGMRIHEYQPTMYHPKLLVIDEHWTTIGSANFDERSFRLNDESNLNVHDRAFALEQIAIFEEDKALSKEITLEAWEGRSAWERFVDWGASLLRAQL